MKFGLQRGQIFTRFLELDVRVRTVQRDHEAIGPRALAHHIQFRNSRAAGTKVLHRA